MHTQSVGTIYSWQLNTLTLFQVTHIFVSYLDSQKKKPRTLGSRIELEATKI